MPNTPRPRQPRRLRRKIALLREADRLRRKLEGLEDRRAPLGVELHDDLRRLFRCAAPLLERAQPTLRSGAIAAPAPALPWDPQAALLPGDAFVAILKLTVALDRDVVRHPPPRRSLSRVHGPKAEQRSSPFD